MSLVALVRKSKARRLALCATTTTSTRGMASASKLMISSRRNAPKTSPHKFTAGANGVPTLTWDPTKGVPPKVNDTDYKSQNTYVIIESASPKVGPSSAAKEAAAAAAARLTAKQWAAATRGSSHMYKRNERRAFPAGTVPVPRAFDLTTPFHRPSLHSLIQSNTTIAHFEVSKSGNTAADLLHRATRQFPAHLKAAMRQSMTDAHEEAFQARKAASEAVNALRSKAKALNDVELAAEKGKGEVSVEVARDNIAEHRAAYLKATLDTTQQGGVQVEAATAADGTEQLSVKLAGADLNASWTVTDANIAEYVAGAKRADGSEQFAATPTTDIVEATGEAPAPASTEPVQLTWKVFRTPQRNLPVYRAYRKGNTRTITILRNFRGDMHALRLAVQSVVGPDVAVVQRLGRIDILGDHVNRLKIWLAQLGF